MFRRAIRIGNWFQQMMKLVDAVVETTLIPVAPSALPGWEADDCIAALHAFQRQALEIQRKGSGFSRAVVFGGRHEDWLPVVAAAACASNAKQFFIENFKCFGVQDHVKPEGLFTGYYEPEVEGSRTPHPDFPVAIYRKPNDLVAFTAAEENLTSLKYGRRTNGVATEYIDRKSIENGAFNGQGLELCWVKSWTDAFFMHIQGSGRVRFSDGSMMRLSYAAKSGLPYSSIGRVLVDQGAFTYDTMSMQALRQWMKAQPHEARELMWQNRSFVFFREIAVNDPKLGAIGAAQVNLTPLRSIAIDRDIWMFGTPFWLDTHYPREVGAKPLQRLMIAQDTGSAIKGSARGDVYWGWDNEAALIAGHMKSTGTLHVFLPHAVVNRLGLPI